MEAAAHGHSTLGIPQKVGAEFANATPKPSSLPDQVKHLLTKKKKRRK